MKKYIITIMFSIFAIISCEKDDICIENTTPNLIIRFYDNDNQTETKQIVLDSVWANNKENIYKNETLDSIILPLDLSQNNTLFKFSSNSSEDEINFTYDRNDIFVSRSCGYKTIFENLQIESNSSNWIKNISINNTIIENDTAAHITIFH